MVIRERQLGSARLNEMFKTIFDGRYLILMMGLFSIYTGFLYNEFFSIPVPIFTSGWTFTPPGPNGTYNGTDCVGQLLDPDYAYPFGVDWAWKGTANSLNYSNSLKMKMSIIFGVVQMTLGIVMHFLNALHFEKFENVMFEFVPQVIFLWSIFGYMCFIIVFKWFISYSDPFNSPLLLNVMIDMLLSPQTLADKDYLYDGQHAVQIILVLCAVVCIPVMLCFKPFYLRYKHNKNQHKNGGSLVEADEENEPLTKKDDHHGGGGHGHGEEFEFGEVMIHQIIHTIEFVLGAISNTASYLRLWALSLAHSQLSEVFFDMVLLRTIELENFAAIWVGFAVWGGATLGVLMGMESLSAFLHALRLHWVEFNNKFYIGDGRPFVPFSYQTILAAAEDQTAKDD